MPTSAVCGRLELSAHRRQKRLSPGDFRPWSTVYYRFRKFLISGLWHRIFVICWAAERKKVGKDPNASAAIIDSQSIKTSEKGGSNGYAAHKNLKARKRHLLVDPLGMPLSICVTPADVQDQAGALVPRLKSWADGAYGDNELARWCEEQGGWDLEIVERNRKVGGLRFCRNDRSWSVH